MRPLDGLVITRTGSRCSRVGPAVTTTRLPDHLLLLVCPNKRSAAARIASGSLIRPGRSLGPSARAPISGPTKCQPRCVSVAMFAAVAGFAYIASFIAGAADTGRSAPPHQAVVEAAADELVERPRGELLFPVDRPVAREVVHEAREFGSHEDAEVLVLRLSCDFCWCHDPHCSTFLLVHRIQDSSFFRL